MCLIDPIGDVYVPVRAAPSSGPAACDTGGFAAV
jgi:hypothetical protein